MEPTERSMPPEMMTMVAPTRHDREEAGVGRRLDEGVGVEEVVDRQPRARRRRGSRQRLRGRPPARRMTSTSPACGDASVRLSISGHRAYPRLRGHSNGDCPRGQSKGTLKQGDFLHFLRTLNSGEAGTVNLECPRGQSRLTVPVECPRNEEPQAANGQRGGVAHRGGLRDAHELRTRGIECDERLGAGALALGHGRTPRRAIRRQLHLVAAREARHSRRPRRTPSASARP